MMNLLALSVLLTLSRSKEDVTLDVMLVDYDGMYNNECSKSTTAAPSSTSYEHGWEKWTKGEGSVKGNEAAKGDSNKQSQQSAVFCKCLDEEKKKGKSYADSQNAFSKCIDKANGNDASHWKKVSKQYEHKYGVKVISNGGKSNGDPANGDIFEAKGEVKAEAEEAKGEAKAKSDGDKSKAEVKGEAKGAKAEVKAETKGAEKNAEDEAKKVEDKAKKVEGVVTKNEADKGMMMVTPSTNSGSFGNTAVIVTFIGSSILLLICACFIKGSGKLKSTQYEQIKINNNTLSYQSDCDQQKNSGSYNGYNVV